MSWRLDPVGSPAGFSGESEKCWVPRWSRRGGGRPLGFRGRLGPWPVIFGRFPMRPAGARPTGASLATRLSQESGVPVPAPKKVKVVSGHSVGGVWRLREGLRPQDEDAVTRRDAMRKWCEILEEMGSHCGFGRKVFSEGLTVEDALEDVVATRTAATLLARASAINAYRAGAKGKGSSPWPLTEQAAYAYVTDLKESNAPATKASSFFKAVLMSGFLF